jgi:hypothetical protein
METRQMETREQARDTILRELMSEDGDVRAEYIKHFQSEMREFAEAMAETVFAWRMIDVEVKGDERRAVVSNLVYAAFTLHIISFKLFVAGLIVPAGNIFRQVVESIAVALLCSGKDLTVLERFMNDQYSPNHAVRDVVRHAEKLQLRKDGLAALESAQSFYHKYSHITRLTLATMISFSEEGAYVGASFDEGKLDAYRKEIKSRLGLASVFPNFIAAVRANLGKWPTSNRH